MKFDCPCQGQLCFFITYNLFRHHNLLLWFNLFHKFGSGPQIPSNEHDWETLYLGTQYKIRMKQLSQLETTFFISPRYCLCLSFSIIFILFFFLCVCVYKIQNSLPSTLFYSILRVPKGS